MKLSILVAICTLVVLVHGAQGFGFGDWFRPRPPGPPPGVRPHGPRPSFFPECQDFMDEVEQKKKENRRNGEGGPWACRKAGLNRQECEYQNALKARNQLPDLEASQDCLNQVQGFFRGSSTNATDSPNATNSTDAIDVNGR